MSPNERISAACDAGRARARALSHKAKVRIGRLKAVGAVANDLARICHEARCRGESRRKHQELHQELRSFLNNFGKNGDG